MAAGSVVHMPVRETQIRKVRKSNQGSTEADQQRMRERLALDVDHDAGQQQRDPRCEEPECAEAPMPAKADRKRRQRKHARECDERALERVVGKETKAERRQRRNDERQRGAVQRTQE